MNGVNPTRVDGIDGRIIFEPGQATPGTPYVYNTDRVTQLNPGDFSLERTAIHEIGHLLGIAAGPGGELYLNSINAGTPFDVYNGTQSDLVYPGGVPIASAADGRGHTELQYHNLTRATPFSESFRNIPYFAPAELAILRDLGYTGLNLNAEFGTAYYSAGTNAPETLVNNFTSSSDYAVGVFIQADDRNLIIDHNMNISGFAGAGVRIAGRDSDINGNTITIAPGRTINISGNEGIGVLASSGAGNVIVHRGVITANGGNGKGMLFDFGPPLTFQATRQIDSSDYDDYLIDRLDISGGITAENGNGNVIEIRNTAAVREINFLNGTSLTGNIHSDALTDSNLNRPTITFGYLADGNGMATTNADVNFSLNYAGNINGTTLMDARFVGGRDHATGTLLTGDVEFNSVLVDTDGHLIANGMFISEGDIDIHGTMRSVAGQITTGVGDEVIIHDGGRLSAAATINTPFGRVDNRQGGTMATGDGIDTLTIVGNYQTNGTVQFGMTHQNLPQDSSLYDIQNGVASINNLTDYANRGTFEFNAEAPADAANYEIARRYTIIETDAPNALQVSQRPQTTDNITDRRIILRSDTDVDQLYSSNAQFYYAYVGRDLPYAALGQTPNQQAIGQYLDDLFTMDDGSALGNEIQWFRDTIDLMPDEQEVLALLNLMTGELYASVIPMVSQQTFATQSRLAARLRHDDSRLDWCDDSDSEVTSGWGGWTAGFGTGGATQANSNAAGYHYSAGGTQAVVTYGLNCESMVGGYYNYTGANFTSSPVGSANAHLNEFGMLFTHHNDVDHFLAIAGGGWADFDTRRGFVTGNTNIQNPLAQSITADYGGSYASLYFEYGRRYDTTSTVLRPFLGLGYVNFTQSDFVEESTGLGALAVNEASIDSLRSMLGADANILVLANGNVRLDARAIWSHDFLDGGIASVTSNFAGVPGAGFVVHGNNIGRDFAIVGTSLSRSYWDGNVRLFTGYDLIANGRQSLNSGNAGVEVLW